MVKDEGFELQFEARFYLAEAQRLRKQGAALLEEADRMLEHAVNTWERVKEVAG